MANHMKLKFGRVYAEKICKTLIPNLLHVTTHTYECQHVKVVELTNDVQVKMSQRGIKELKSPRLVTDMIVSTVKRFFQNCPFAQQQ